MQIKTNIDRHISSTVYTHMLWKLMQSMLSPTSSSCHLNPGPLSSPVTPAVTGHALWCAREAAPLGRRLMTSPAMGTWRMHISMKNWKGPYQRTPKEVARAIRYWGLGLRSVGPVGDFLEHINQRAGGRNGETTLALHELTKLTTFTWHQHVKKSVERFNRRKKKSRTTNNLHLCN